ncbi:MAG: PKD domain-containing protein [Agriterribacter sp.]
MKQSHPILKYFRRLLLLAFTVPVFLQLNAQTQGITDSVYKGTGIPHGYYYSLPNDYSSNPSKTYPLLIALHGSGEAGNGTTDLSKMLKEGTIPYILYHNNFRASFEVDDEAFSFIVVCAQYAGDIQGENFLTHLKSQYRIDTTRVYFTGLSEGGLRAWKQVYDTLNFLTANPIAAMVLTSPSISENPYLAVGSPYIGQAHSSNLPLWLTQNLQEDTYTSTITGTVNKLTSRYNGLSPTPQPLAKKQVFSSPSDIHHDSWKKVYNAANKIDSANDYNIYQWMLQFTNKRLVAKAGKDTSITLPANSVTLTGKATVRQGRIDSVRWSKVAGPATFTITSPTSYSTTVSGLVAGTYQFELKVAHSDGLTVEKDTVQVIVSSNAQTQTKIVQNVSTNIKGYLRSLPVNYNTDTTKRFPLIISLHGVDAAGDSTSGIPLDSVANQGIPKLIRDGQFPASFEVDNKSYSFIVVSPQINSATPSFIHNQLNTLLTHLKSTLRIDAERVYVAGLGIGGGFGYTFAIGGTTTTNVGFPDSIAAMVGAGSNVPSVNATQRARLVQSNLPHWLTHNNADPIIASSKSSNAISSYNSSLPTPSPSGKLTLFTASTQDSWTTTYSPNYVLDSSTGYNVYEWLLQYTNKRVVARAGADTAIVLPVDSVILNGSNSTARNGRASYLWTQVQGTSATILSDANAVTKVSGLAGGVNKFELKLTHDSTFAGNVVRDTVTITVSNSSPRIAPPVVSLIRHAETTDELLRVSISPTVAQSQLTVLITGRAKGKTSLQLSGIDGRRVQRQSFVKDATTLTRIFNVASLASGIYLIEVTINGKYRKVLRFVKQ